LNQQICIARGPAPNAPAHSPGFANASSTR